MFKWLAVAGRLGNQYVDQQLVRYNLNSGCSAYILHICRDPGLTQDSLRLRVHVNPSNITRALNHLEKHGYITREVLPQDKRTSRLYPTKLALEVCSEVKRVVNEWITILTNGMSERDITTFHSLLTQVGNNAADHFYLE